MIRFDSLVKYLIPLFLISPMFNIGGFGLTLAELSILIVASIFMFTYQGPIRMPVIFIIFLTLFIIGRLGAFINSLDYNIPVNYSKAVFLFIIFVQVGSYILGRYSGVSWDEIIISKYTKVLFLILTSISVIYLIVDGDTRIRLLSIFMPTGMDLARLNVPRFPGLGINANIYSFIAFMFFTISVRTYLRNKTNALIPILCLIVILTITSKTTILIAVVTLLVHSMFYYFHTDSNTTTKRKTIGIFWGLLFFSIITIVASITFSEYILLVQRFDELIGNSDNVNSLDDRYELWRLGFERIKMAPILGIDVVQAELISDTLPIYFATPHNEFLFYWMSLGIAGLLAYSILLIYLVWINLFPKIRIEWIIIYSALIIQMTFDGAFQTLRFQFIFFIFMGLNFREMAIERTKDYEFKLQ